MPTGTPRFAPGIGNQDPPASASGLQAGSALFTIGSNAFLNSGTIPQGSTVTAASQAASTLLGNPTGGTAAATTIPLGAGLAFSSGSLISSAGTIPIAVPSGGTGLTTLTDHAIIIGAGAADVTFLAPTGNGNVVASNGTVWASEAGQPLYLPMVDAKSSSGVPITATPGSNAFGISHTFPGSEFLLSETANSSTVTDGALFEIPMPVGYLSNAAITATVNARYTLGAGTIGTHTIALGFYTISNAGVITQIGGSTVSLPSSATDITFTSAGTMPNVGALLQIVVTIVVQDVGGSAITAQINSIRLSW